MEPSLANSLVALLSVHPSGFAGLELTTPGSRRGDGDMVDPHTLTLPFFMEMEFLFLLI